MNACTFDHPARGRHSTDCPRTDCTGCAPAQAADGTLYCRHHLTRIHLTLTETPDLVTHIRDHITPGAGVLDSSPRPGRREPPPPLNVTALSDADDLHAALAELAELVMDARHLEGPDWAGTDIRPPTRRRTGWGETVYLPARAAGVRDPVATAAVTAWLMPHEPWLTATEDAVGALDGILRLSGILRHRWPVEEEPRHLPTPCPACDMITLTRHAPRWQGAPVTITCTRPDCSHTIPEDQYGLLTRVILHERRYG